ncbi:VOC family protein [Gordonia amarae]|uniref:Catechol 2,3-dioxygenase n=2 Tax=Gordonia amarae TaxID=36821 RepID=G7GLB4_9ACTN|nr:VOC family protein [Gordonia amarae]GAB04389.1 catechol 2,3-dioxygenase [Gordonia amarae NBRC 15530]
MSDRQMSTDSVYGNVRLGYLIVESNKMLDWHRFGADAIGLHVDELSRDALRFRLDDHECRFLIRRGPAEDLTAIGWQVTDHGSFDRILARLVDRGVPVDEGTPEEAALRGVERLWRFPGPKGVVQEIFTTARTTVTPLRMITSGYVTGAAGMGHVAVTTKDPAGIHRYYDTVFDAHLSDLIDENISGVRMKIRFLRVNERHHSIALAGTRGVSLDPIRTSVQHVNIQVADLEDMLAAYQRVTDLGFRMAWTVGQHTNDRELSFYCVTPSGFELEVGWNPVLVTPELDAAWEVTTYQGISIWGHDDVGLRALDRLSQVRQAVLSARAREVSVPELSGAAAGGLTS